MEKLYGGAMNFQSFIRKVSTKTAEEEGKKKVRFQSFIGKVSTWKPLVIQIHQEPFQSFIGKVSLQFLSKHRRFIRQGRV